MEECWKNPDISIGPLPSAMLPSTCFQQDSCSFLYHRELSCSYTNVMCHGCLIMAATCVNSLIFSKYRLISSSLHIHVLTMKILSIFRIISLLETAFLILRTYFEIYIYFFIHLGLQKYLLRYFIISNCS